MDRMLTVPFALALALTATGCEKKITAVCEDKCGSSADACIAAEEQAEATAEERGCEGDFEAFASCAADKATCTAGVLDASACAAEAAAVTACVNQ